MRKLLIVGASVRAAAQSAVRAGLAPIGFDLFADRDLAKICPSRSLDHAEFPAAFASLAAELVDPEMPWMYTGALENHPALINKLALDRPLWGNSGRPIQLARDPRAWTDALRAASIDAADVRLSSEDVPIDGSWLAKPRASAGGRGIKPLFAANHEHKGMFYQERIAGPSFSAVFVLGENDAELIGATRQLLGLPDAPFAYRGSAGPWPIEPKVEKRLKAIGRILGDRLGLRGLTGVDYILGDDGTPIPVEINPRYSASIEVLELGLFRPVLDAHRRVFEANPTKPSPSQIHAQRFVAKSVVFAESQGRFPDDVGDGLERERIEAFDVPLLADIPAAGTPFKPGAPVLTVLAEAPRLDECLTRLRESVEAWRARLRRISSP